MTLDELYNKIEKLQDENSAAWDTCGNIADMGYYEGFNAACEEILDIIREGERNG